MTDRNQMLAALVSGAKWDVAVAIKRGNPLPLDESAIYGSYEEALAYVQKADTTAYPGQILSVVNADGTNVYYGVEQNGTLKELGAATLGDDKSIVLGDGSVLSLKNFGEQYYKYVNILPTVDAVEDLSAEAATGTYCYVNGEVKAWYVKAEAAWTVTSDHPSSEADHYVLTEGFVAGLQPKVVLAADGQTFELAWYEPSSTTVEGLSEQMSSLTQTVNTVQGAVSSMYTNEQIDEKLSAIPQWVEY